MADEKTPYSKNSLLIGGDTDFHPPYSKDRQYAELQVYRFAFLKLATLLHEKGVLDLEELRHQLSEGVVWFQHRPASLESLDWLLELLDYRRAKQGPAGATAAERSNPE